MDFYNQARCPVYASFFGMMGCSLSIICSCLGASYGIAKSSIGISSVSVLHPENMIRNLMPPILAGILAIYGLVVSVIITTNLHELTSLHTNFLYLGAGLAVGLSCLAAGFSIGIIGDAGVRGAGLQPKMFVGMMMMLIFAEILGIYGFIVALLMITQATQNVTVCL